MNHILITIDVEDWYQVENLKQCIPFSTWSSCESRIERNTHNLLDLFDSVFEQTRIATTTAWPERPKATFFVLGWLAERMPGLVREIHARGHEVGSHGYYHKLCNQCSPAELTNDLSNSRILLEDIIGVPVIGYRAPNFSISENVLRQVEACGYHYDSSFNSYAANKRYGRINLPMSTSKGIARRCSDGLHELPISNLRLWKHQMPLGGGGYFRLIPLPVFLYGIRSILKKQGAYVFYMHPWEIDPDQPRVREAALTLRLRHYANLHSTFRKLAELLDHLRDCRFVTCSQYLRENAS